MDVVLALAAAIKILLCSSVMHFLTSFILILKFRVNIKKKKKNTEMTPLAIININTFRSKN